MAKKKEISYSVKAGFEDVALGGVPLKACTQKELERLYNKGNSNRIERKEVKKPNPPPEKEKENNDTTPE